MLSNETSRPTSVVARRARPAGVRGIVHRGVLSGRCMRRVGRTSRGGSVQLKFGGLESIESGLFNRNKFRNRWLGAGSSCRQQWRGAVSGCGLRTLLRSMCLRLGSGWQADSGRTRPHRTSSLPRGISPRNLPDERERSRQNSALAVVETTRRQRSNWAATLARTTRKTQESASCEEWYSVVTRVACPVPEIPQGRAFLFKSRRLLMLTYPHLWRVHFRKPDIFLGGRGLLRAASDGLSRSTGNHYLMTTTFTNSPFRRCSRSAGRNLPSTVRTQSATVPANLAGINPLGRPWSVVMTQSPQPIACNS